MKYLWEKGFERCLHCGYVKDINKMTHIIIGNKNVEDVFYCNDCLEKLGHFVCDLCNQNWLFKHKNSYKRKGKIICRNCFSFLLPKYYGLCNRCGDCFSIEKLTETGKDKFLCCKNCLEDLKADYYHYL